MVDLYTRKIYYIDNQKTLIETVE